MSFDDLPLRPKANFPAAIAYAEEILARSRTVAESADVRFMPDIAYGPDYYQKIDLYLPPVAQSRMPVLLFLHGGAWSGGYKEWMGFMAAAITRTPAIFVSVSYRLAPEALFPAAVQDTASAVAWVVSNIAEHGGDPERIFIGGHSAGGHLASLVAFDPFWLAAHGLSTSTITGVLPLSASFDLAFDPTNPDNAPHIAIRDRFMPAGTDVVAASPISHVRAGLAPCYIAAGADDFQILIDDAERLAEALRDVGVASRVDIFAGANHFDASARCVDEGHPWISCAQAFLRSGEPD